MEGGRLDAGADWKSRASDLYALVPLPVRQRVCLTDPPAGDAVQHGFYWQGVCSILTPLVEDQDAPHAQDAGSAAAAAAAADVVLDITRVPEYQMLAERVASASAAEWSAPIKVGPSSAGDMFGVRSGTHPMEAAVQLLRMATADSSFQVDNNKTKSRGSAGFYLYHGGGSSRFRKDRKVRSKASFWDAVAAMADTRVDWRDVASAFKLPSATRDALKGLRAGIRSVLSVEMREQFDKV